MYRYFFDINIYKKVKGVVDIMKEAKRQVKMFLGVLSDFNILWATKERIDIRIVATTHAS
jgi:ribosome maturation protein Sdo1